MRECNIHVTVLVAEQVNGLDEVDLKEERKRQTEKVKDKLSSCLRVLEGKMLKRIEYDPVGYGKAVGAFVKTVEGCLHRPILHYIS